MHHSKALHYNLMPIIFKHPNSLIRCASCVLSSSHGVTRDRVDKAGQRSRPVKKHSVCLSIQMKNTLWTLTTNSTYVHRCVIWLLKGKCESVPFQIAEVCANCWSLCWNPTLNGLSNVPTYSRLWQCCPRIGTSQCCTDLSTVVANIRNEYTSKIQGTKTTNRTDSCLSRAYPLSPSHCPWINIHNNT